MDDRQQQIAQAARARFGYPDNHEWRIDAEPTGERLTLWRTAGRRGEVGAAYLDGRWFCNSPDGSHARAANGREDDLESAMHRLLSVAWGLGHRIIPPWPVAPDRHFHGNQGRAHDAPHHDVRVVTSTGAHDGVAHNGVVRWVVRADLDLLQRYEVFYAFEIDLQRLGWEVVRT